jgi:hypothetical protein
MAVTIDSPRAVGEGLTLDGAFADTECFCIDYTYPSPPRAKSFVFFALNLPGRAHNP